MSIVPAGIRLFDQNEQFKARLMESDEKPDNPRLIALVPDPEKRSIFKAVLSLLSKDSTKRRSIEDMRAWGGLGAKARNEKLNSAARKKIASDAAKARWAKTPPKKEEESK